MGKWIDSVGGWRRICDSSAISLDAFIPRVTCHIHWMNEMFKQLEDSPWMLNVSRTTSLACADGGC